MLLVIKSVYSSQVSPSILVSTFIDVKLVSLVKLNPVTRYTNPRSTCRLGLPSLTSAHHPGTEGGRVRIRDPDAGKLGSSVDGVIIGADRVFVTAGKSVESTNYIKST